MSSSTEIRSPWLRICRMRSRIGTHVPLFVANDLFTSRTSILNGAAMGTG